MNKILGMLPGAGFFIYFAIQLEELKFSSLFGILAISIAMGSVVYFFFNAPEGRRKQETAFGVTSKYRIPVYGTVIPNKVAIFVIVAIVINCLLGLLFYHYGY